MGRAKYKAEQIIPRLREAGDDRSYDQAQLVLSRADADQAPQQWGACSRAASSRAAQQILRTRRLAEADRAPQRRGAWFTSGIVQSRSS
jgi:hypothetical protein